MVKSPKVPHLGARPPETLIVDGYNVIHKSPQLQSLANTHLENARNQLIQMVGRYSSNYPWRVLLVFDGKEEAPWGSSLAGQNVDIRFSVKPQTADDVIVEYIREHSGQERMTVVTSDRKDIGVIARSHGIPVIDAFTFLKMLSSSAKKKSELDGKPEIKTRADFNHWMEFFKERAK